MTGGLLVNYVERAYPDIHSPFAEPRDRAVERPLEWERQVPRAPQILNRQFVEQLDSALQLTSEQREKIGKIIADGQERNRDLWKLVSPQFRVVMQDVRQRIRAVLTPVQRKQFEELMKQFPPRRPAEPTNSPSSLPSAAPTNAPSSGT